MEIILKKLSIALAALAAMSVASHAWDKNYGNTRNSDLRDTDVYQGHVLKKKRGAYSAAAPLAVNDGRALTNFERMQLTIEANENGRK
jgi:hypothetical protein